MEMEARSLPPTVSQPLLAKVKDYKTDLAALKEQMNKAQSAAPVGDAARAELVRGISAMRGAAPLGGAAMRAMHGVAPVGDAARTDLVRGRIHAFPCMGP